ncbi:hypothetical protein LINGRAHAP2_LOCUS21471, partial [Linum grandiflorum]
IKVEYIHRKGNRAADYLAGQSHILLIGVHYICTSDPTLSMHILYDWLGR